MKSKQIKLVLLCCVLTLLSLPLARGADEGGDLLPAPTMDTPNPDPAPQAALPDSTQNNSVNTTPEEDLPPPSAGQTTAEDSKLQVNKPLPSDEVFLPAPAQQDNITYTPMGNPVVPNSVYDTSLNPVRSRERPPFGLFIGYANRSYASSLVQGAASGFEGGAEYRVLSLGETVYLSVYGSLSYLSLGPVGNFTNVKDTTYHIGPELQIDLGRRFTLFGSLLLRGNSLSTDPNASIPQAQLATIAQKATFQLGGGIQYDFYKDNHSSVGLRGYIEQNYGAVLLTLALEPIPNRKPEMVDDAQ